MPFLTAAIFALGVTVFAVNRTVFPGFEGNFALFFAIRTNRFVHLPRPSVISTLKSHTLSPFFRVLILKYQLITRRIIDALFSCEKMVFSLGRTPDFHRPDVFQKDAPGKNPFPWNCYPALPYRDDENG